MIRFLSVIVNNGDSAHYLKMEKMGQNENDTNHHSEYRIGGLEAIRTFFPEIAIPLNGGDVASNATSRLRDEDVGGDIRVLGGEGLSDAEAANSSTDDHTIHHGRGASALGSRKSGALGDGASEIGANVIASERDVEWVEGGNVGGAEKRGTVSPPEREVDEEGGAGSHGSEVTEN